MGAATGHSGGIDGSTRLLGLLGERIAYTRSPLLHNLAAKVLGRNEVYLPLPLPAGQVGEFLRVAWHLGATGFNVTTPHKELVAELYPSGLGLSSVNTVYRGPTGWQTASTDGEGFARALLRLGRPLNAYRRVVFLGSGGATMALVCYMVAAFQLLPEFQIVRRDPSRDQTLKRAIVQRIAGEGRAADAADLDGLVHFIPWDLAAVTAALGGFGEETLLIQASSAPQRGDDLAHLVPALAQFHGTVCDLVYGKPSALYRAALAKGLPAQDGEAMLIEQARLSQQLWWGTSASFEELEAALREP